MKRLFKCGNGERVLAATERPIVEAFESVDHDGNQRFVRDPVGDVFAKRTTLERNYTGVRHVVWFCTRRTPLSLNAVKVTGISVLFIFGISRD